ncbi:Gfo/Idh/MocA family protein [Dactylosporangium sp. CA-152071]|uniref:Gfo/Idh/MocA family protein n=1 Tax=Dactylosporangium sp. CA-152071 TaxID=3239933 RepID=UPI003D9107A8
MVAGRGAGPVPCRIALVGMGWAARSIWLPRLAGRAGLRLVAVVDRDPSAWAGVDLDDSVARHRDLAGLDPGDVDLAVVAVPNHLHCEVACRLLDRGISVFLEKPVCLTSAEVTRLAEAERSAGATLLAGSAALYRSDLEALRRVRPSIGRLRHVELAWVRARGVPSAGEWFTRRHLSGGGALIDLGSHLLDVGGALLGYSEVSRVVGTTSSLLINNQSWRAAWRDEQPPPAQEHRSDVEDTAYGFLVTAGGTGVSLRASWASHEVHDATTVVLEGIAGTATLRTTFGFSPNRLPRPVLTVARGGRVASVPLPEERIGVEYDRQLDDLPALLGDPAARGRAIRRAGWSIDVLERIYSCAAALGPPSDALTGPVPAAIGRASMD